MRTLAVGTAALLSLAIAAGCGSDKEPTVTGSPGTITVSSTAIANQAGRFLVVFAFQNNQPVARACLEITSNSFVAGATTLVETSAGANPCDAGGTTKAFAAGTYTVTAGVYVGGAQTAEISSSQTVQVDGNATVSFAGSTLSR